MILLDFVAEKGGMRIVREDSSDIAAVEAPARGGAQGRRAVGVPGRAADRIVDDHTPFLRRGVPAIDLIDFTFDCWHKPCDDMNAVSARALDLTGETVVQMLLDLSQ